MNLFCKVGLVVKVTIDLHYRTSAARFGCLFVVIASKDCPCRWTHTLAITVPANVVVQLLQNVCEHKATSTTD